MKFINDELFTENDDELDELDKLDMSSISLNKEDQAIFCFKSGI